MPSARLLGLVSHYRLLDVRVFLTSEDANLVEPVEVLLSGGVPSPEVNKIPGPMENAELTVPKLTLSK